MADLPETLGIPPKGIPPTDRHYREIVGQGRLRPLGVLDVREFGALGDGNHDDYGAIQRTLDAVKRGGGGAVYLPPGTYKCSAQPTLTSARIELFGAGRAQTILEWSAASGGLGITQSAGSDRTIVRDLSLRTTASGGGTGLAITGPASPGNNYPIIQNVHFDGSGYWTKGIVLTDLMQARIEGVRLSGNRTGTTHGIHLAGNCTDTIIRGCHIDHVGRGVYINGATEGFVIQACILVGVTSGVDVDNSASSKAWADVSDCHINAHNYGVLLDNHVESIVHDNLIYRHTDGTGDFYGIQMKNLNDRSRITSNIINSLNTTGTRRGIQIAGRWVLIADNVIRQVSDAILLASGSDDCVVHDNMKIGASPVVVNNGSTPAENIHDNFLG